MAQARDAGLGGSPKGVYTPPSAKEALKKKNDAAIAKYASKPVPAHRPYSFSLARGQ